MARNVVFHPYIREYPKKETFIDSILNSIASFIMASLNLQ